MQIRPMCLIFTVSRPRRADLFPHPPAAASAPLPQGERRVRATAGVIATVMSLFSAAALLAQDAVTSTSDVDTEAEAEAVIVSATRTDIPLDQSPAGVSVISSDEFEQKQIER